MTTTIPVEVVLAAGRRPVDLNNRFIAEPEPGAVLAAAEAKGLGQGVCAWIRGIYGWCLEHPQLKCVIGVREGDCSATHGLMELLAEEGIEVVSFGFPSSRDPRALAREIEALARAMGTTVEQAEQVRRELEGVRGMLLELERLGWEDGKVSGVEMMRWLLGASDFEGDPGEFARRLGEALARARAAPGRQGGVRLGLVGVPPAMVDLVEVMEELGARVVYLETPRQFAMVPAVEQGVASLVEQYLLYSYPYTMGYRLKDINRQVAIRGIHGLVHYVQAFCHRRVHDALLRRHSRVRVLTLEGDEPGSVDGRTRLRLEAFVEMLAQEL